MKFIGREVERSLLQKTLSTPNLETILIYGRRRVGKSELIKQCIKETNIKSIYYECKQTTEMNNVESLSLLISETFNLPPLSFKSFEEILEFIFKQAQEQKLLLVLDEYSYIRDKVTGCDSILQVLIDKYSDTSSLKLILCGSYIDIMKSLIQVQSPLYGRVTRTIDLKPMDYYDSSKFYETFSNEDKVKLYSVFGGIPYYNRLIDANKTVQENIIDLIASPNARLETEVSMYLKSEISKITNANEVFEAMAKGHTKYKSIMDNSHVSSSPTLADVLDKLIKMEIVCKQAPINDDSNKKKASYTICDNLSLFFYKYIFKYSSQMSVMNSDIFYNKYIKEDFESQYVPHIFETICKQYLIRLNKAGELNETFEKIGKYYYDNPINKTNGEFDIVTQDQNGYIFYEAKFRNSKLTHKQIEYKINQVKATDLQAYKYGFFSKSGYESTENDNVIYYTLDDLYK